MMNKYTINKIDDVLVNRKLPTITIWNRLEGRPRRDDFNRALKAEIRDPLWMLTKQWQMGEFEMDDAGSPAGAKVHLTTTMLNKFKPADKPARPYDSANEPLEAIVEQQTIPMTWMNDRLFSLDLRIMMGRQWIKMLKKNVGDFKDFFLTNGFGISSPADPDNKDDAFILAHPETWQDFAAANNRQVDGYKVFTEIIKGTNIGAGSGAEADIANEADKFAEWVKKFFLQPDEDENAWLPQRLEYQFACSAPEGNEGSPSEKIYKAEEYYTGRLDWFNLSIADSEKIDMSVEEEVNQDVRNTLTASFIPSNIDFGGMPNTRWWTFENKKTYLGDINPDTHEIGKLLLSEFTLLYANDWFIIPQELKGGTISSVEGLVVTNVFGERTWVNPSGKGKDDNWKRWTMFTVDIEGKDLQEADNSLLLLPVVPKIQEGKPIEEFVMIRDEVANMVWAIEMGISTPSGRKEKAAEAARELAAFYTRLVEQNPATLPDTEPTASIRYKIMSTVPENWIPFIPVHMENNRRQIQLQRAAMPRITPGQDPEDIERIQPRTILLRNGLDTSPKKAYYIYEEEVPRAGIDVSRAYQRTRWYNGKSFIWLGIRKKTGRGEGSSGLRFDYLKNVE